MNYAEQAALDLKRTFGRLAPHQLVTSGECSLNDWLRALDARREEFEVSFSNQAQDVKSANVTSHVRLMILGAISDGASSPIEILAAQPLKTSTLERELQRLQEEGIIEHIEGCDRIRFTLTRRGQRALNALRYQTANPIPFEPVQPNADQDQMNAA
jgi:DNA-binding PadR family transcriptional regulator